MHPRSEANKYRIPKENMINGTPIEMMIINEKITDNVFVSITSSATTNFKVVFDEEPVVVMLYRIFSTKSSASAEYEMYIQKVKDSYRSQNFYIPKSEDEFFEIIADYEKHWTKQKGNDE